MSEQILSSEKERIKVLFLEAAEKEADAIAKLLADSSNEDLLGKTEFALRDAVLRLGAKTLESAANERAKKKAIKEAAPRVAVANQPGL